MPLSNSPLAYEDCRALLDRALISERGIKVACETPGKAMALRQRLNKARQMDRKSMAEVYDSEDPRSKVSSYDALFLKVDGADVVLEKSAGVSFNVQDL